LPVKLKVRCGQACSKNKTRGEKALATEISLDATRLKAAVAGTLKEQTLPRASWQGKTELPVIGKSE
jgi:hypothetical protein